MLPRPDHWVIADSQKNWFSVVEKRIDGLAEQVSILESANTVLAEENNSLKILVTDDIRGLTTRFAEEIDQVQTSLGGRLHETEATLTAETRSFRSMVSHWEERLERLAAVVDTLVGGDNIRVGGAVAAVASVGAGAAPAPAPGWTVHTCGEMADPAYSGQEYYYHPVHGSRWDQPPPVAAAPAQPHATVAAPVQGNAMVLVPAPAGALCNGHMAHEVFTCEMDRHVQQYMTFAKEGDDSAAWASVASVCSKHSLDCCWLHEVFVDRPHMCIMHQGHRDNHFFRVGCSSCMRCTKQMYAPTAHFLAQAGMDTAEQWVQHLFNSIINNFTKEWIYCPRMAGIDTRQTPQIAQMPAQQTAYPTALQTAAAIQIRGLAGLAAMQRAAAVDPAQQPPPPPPTAAPPGWPAAAPPALERPDEIS